MGRECLINLAFFFFEKNSVKKKSNMMDKTKKIKNKKNNAVNGLKTFSFMLGGCSFGQ